MRTIAEQLENPDERTRTVAAAAFALSRHILMQGSHIGAAGGDKLAGRRARRMAAALTAEHRARGLSA